MVTIIKQNVLSDKNMPRRMYDSIEASLNEKCRTQKPGCEAPVRNFGRYLLFG